MTIQEYHKTRKHPLRIIATVIGKLCIRIFMASVRWRDKVERTNEEQALSESSWPHRMASLYMYFAKYVHASDDAKARKGSAIFTMVVTSSGDRYVVTNVFNPRTGEGVTLCREVESLSTIADVVDMVAEMFDEK